MRVLFVASECTPLAKVGGLGDVIGALPKTLVKLGIDPIIVLPYYQAIEEYKPKKTAYEVTQADEGGEQIVWTVFETVLPGTGVQVLLLRHPQPWFKEIYGSPDDPFRFAAFSNAAAELARQLKVDVVHCHDWHTSLTTTVLKGDKIPTVLTIHNVHPGTEMDHLDKSELAELGIDSKLLATVKKDHPGYDLLAQGVMAATHITTVSPTHAEEIKTEEFGGDLAKIFQARSKNLEGIVNGIDTEVFDPATDTNLAANYSVSDLAGKSDCRRDLETVLGWENSDEPILGIVTRLTSQKGVDLIAEILPQLSNAGMRVVILGSGEEALESKLKNLARKYSKNLKAELRFDAALAQKIYAGADMFLMPSRFEPCGLGQLIAMRYGTIPIVNETGGLADTVIDNQTGFVFSPLSAKNLLTTIERAVAVWQDHASWQTVVHAAMSQDFSWTKSAERYAEMYRQLTSE